MRGVVRSGTRRWTRRRRHVEEAFQECQEGRCDCPTDEYDKVSTLTVENEGNDAITVRLVAKSGERFDESEIDAFLQHTVAKTQD